MKKVIRKNVFETNSSSTHSICISKKKINELPKFISFRFGEFGWESSEVYDTEDYLYTALVELEMTDKIDQLKKILDNYNIKYEFQEKSDNDRFYDYGYIDHCGELNDLINDLFNDEDKLLRYLFGDSVIYTGNDNQRGEDDSCNSSEEFIYDENYNKIPNPNYHPDEYDYYYKGN